MEKSGLGHNIQSYRQMGNMAVDFNVESLGYYWRDGAKSVPQTTVTVQLKNKAGHAIPDG